MCVYVGMGRGGMRRKGKSYFFVFKITCIMLVGISVIFSGTSLNGGNTLKEKTKRIIVIN